MALSGYALAELILATDTAELRRGRRRADGVSVLVKSTRAELASETRALEELRLPEVPELLEVIHHDGWRHAILAGEGAPLRSCARGPEGIATFFEVARSLVGVVGALHRQGLVHQGLCPQALLFDDARHRVQLIELRVDTTPAAAFAPYLSPEQTGRMNRGVDARTDFYSLGITFFELLTGHLPFSASDSIGWAHSHISKPAPDPRAWNAAIPEALAAIVLKLLAKDPDQRYQGASGLARDLATCEERWRAQGEVAVFPLGLHDATGQLAVSSKIVGREAETHAVLAALERVCTGGLQLVLVSGAAGLGKSSLVREVQPRIAGRDGIFVSGVCDPHERNVPYAAVIQALRGFVKHLLAQPEQRLASWTAAITDALGPHGKAVSTLVPELEQIVGPQPPLPELSAQEARARLQRTFRELFRACARAEAPLVMFIDNLPWADAGTFELLRALLADTSLNNLLLIGAMRDGESEDPAATAALRALEGERPEAIVRLPLAPLTDAQVCELVADSLQTSASAVTALAETVFAKTAGNPFFVNELLAALHREGALTFQADEGRWSWDEARVRAISVTANVADLVVTRLQRLSPEALAVVLDAAFLGQTFELELLARATGRPVSALLPPLAEAVAEGVLWPVGPRGPNNAGEPARTQPYGFQHERIREGAYRLRPEEARRETHLRIGRILASGLREGIRDDRLFDVVNHLNLGRALMTDPAERIALARLDQQAGQRAKQAGAYAIALPFFEQALAALGPAPEGQEAELAFACALARAECTFLTGEVDQAGAMADALTIAAPSKVARAAAVELRVTILEQQGRLQDVVEVIRTNLALFGIELPSDHAEIDRRIGEGIGTLHGHLARIAIEELPKLPELTDPDLRAAMNLLFQVIPAAIQTYPPLFVLGELLMFDLAVTHGVTCASSKNFVDCGIILGAILGDYDRAYRMGKAAFAMLERYAPTPLASSVHFVFGAFVSHWRAPVEESFEAFATSFRTGTETGDVRHASYALVHGLQRLWLVGRNLDECHAKGQEAMAYVQEVRSTLHAHGTRAAQRVVAGLRGELPLGHPKDEFTDELIKLGNGQWLYSYGQAQLAASFLLGEWETAEAWLAFTQPTLGASAGLFSGPDYHLFEALVRARRASQADQPTRAALLALLTEKEGKLRVWAENSPSNFSHKHKLCLAELARVRGDGWREVVGGYDDALAATPASFVNMRALIHELLGLYWLDEGQAKLARGCLEEAYALYAAWGARAKTARLAARFPTWFGARETARAGASALDLDSITKATRAISGEVRAERLFAKLMSTLIESAGAERGFLILSHERGDLTVEAEARVDGRPVETASGAPLESCTGLSSSIVRYVARSRETVVLDNASTDRAYRTDRHVQTRGVKSLLCLPILNQGALVAIFYAENNEAPRAFTAERLSVLQIIAGQAAISITNADLYRNLEDKVADRTRALAEKSREIAAMLNNLQQGIFTIGPDLNIGGQYSPFLETIIGRGDLSGQPVLELLFANAAVGAAALDAMKTAIQFSFDTPRYLAEVNLTHLVRSFERKRPGQESQHLEMDWDLLVDDDDQVVRLLAVVRDVTRLRQLEKAVAADARELDLVGQILDAGLDRFRAFSQSTEGLLDEVTALLSSPPPYERELIDLMFRNMHTVKGEARMLGLGHLVDVVHMAEEPFSRLRARPGTAREQQEAKPRLKGALAEVGVGLEEYTRVFENKLGQLAKGEGVGTSRRLDEIRAVVAEAHRQEVLPAHALERIGHILDEAGAVPLQQVVKDCARMLPSLAKELGKEAPVVSCDAQGIVLVPRWERVLRKVLVHAFRNAIDHGIETTAERATRGKGPSGRITLELRPTPGGHELRVSDDGRGLRLAQLRTQLARPTASDEELAETVFQSGVSTAGTVSATSGRGVGMDAVRAFLRQEGGDACLVFGGDEEDGCRPFVLVCRLPAGATLGQGLPASGASPARPLAREGHATTTPADRP